MNKNLYPFIAAFIFVVASTSCTGTKTADAVEVDSLGLDWDSLSAPLPMNEVEFNDKETGETSGLIPAYIMEGPEDSARLAPIIDSYHTMYSNASLSRMITVKYANINNGPEYGSIISGDYASYMKAYRFGWGPEGHDIGDGFGFAFNDTFLKNHKIISFDVDIDKQMPSALKDTLAARYNMKIQRSAPMAESKEAGIAVYAVQMEPKDKKVLAMHVITVGDSIYVHEEWTKVLEDGLYSWNVDDEGTYIGGDVCAITKGDKGYDIFLLSMAPESTNYTALLLRDGNVNVVDLANYYNDIDYTPPFEAVSLPKGSELKAELDGYKVWIHTDSEGNEDGFNAVYSVYYSKPGSKDVYRLVTAGKDPNSMDKYIDAAKDDVILVDPKDLNTAQEAFIVKNSEGEYRLILQGCPDARNMYCFTIGLPVENITDMYRWVRCFEGFHGVDKATNTLMFATYAYHDEGGRYGIHKYFSFDDLELVKTEILEDE